MLNYSIADNLVLNTYYLPPFANGVARNDKAINEQAVQLVQQYDVRTPSPFMNVGTLSGGNKQKVIIARELSRPINLLIAAQPTRGVDVGSIEFIHKTIVSQRDAGTAVLLISAELGEYVRDDTVGSTTVLPSIVLRPADGDGPTIIGVHPIAPVPGELANWRADLAWLDEVCTGERVIMAGDLNATADHFTATDDGPGLGSCVDAALASGAGAVGTWPTRLPPLLGAPIDHVLATPDLEIRGFRVITTRDDAGSDHRPVVARLAP